MDEQEEKEDYRTKLYKMMRGSARRDQLGLGVSYTSGSIFFDSGVSELGNIELIGNKGGESCQIIATLQENFSISKNLWQLLRRSKSFLSMRAVSSTLIERLDLRRDWNLSRSVDTLLDLFPSLKYSYSSLRGRKFNGVVEFSSRAGRSSVSDIARSHSIRLDPVDAPKELFKYRLRLQKIIAWAYANDLVPILMTLTIFHRWQPLASLCRVLGGAWSELFRGPFGLKRKARIGLRGYVRRMEETFNDGDYQFSKVKNLNSEVATKVFNSGWHPHYHVLMFVPRDKLSVVSTYENELRRDWVTLVQKFYRREFGEDIPSSYYETFLRHGLFFSRYRSTLQARRYGNRFGRRGDLFEVKDGFYLSKLLGLDNSGVGIDLELTSSSSKSSKVPFDLLRGEVTANAVDLWCEYAIATKKIPCFTFSHGLQKEVDQFFETQEGLKDFCQSDCSGRNFSFSISDSDYRLLYRKGEVGNLLKKMSEGFDVVENWLRVTFGIDVRWACEGRLNASAEVFGDDFVVDDFHPDLVVKSDEEYSVKVEDFCKTAIKTRNPSSAAPLFQNPFKRPFFARSEHHFLSGRRVKEGRKSLAGRNKEPP